MTGLQSGEAGEHWLGRDRWVALSGLAAISLGAWGYLFVMASDMSSMPAMAMDATPKSWSLMDAGAMLMMWWVMMVAMMLPGAAPMILTFANINRRRRERGQTYITTTIFAAGYIIAWGGYSLVATAAQWSLEEAALLSPMTMAASPLLGAGLLIAAGIYQFLPFKHACLRHCRTPLDFVLNHWRDGAGGALRMGTEHGLYCLGCCWVMMALLFVFGVMNLIWVAALTALVIIEKIAPGGAWIARAGGVAMVLAGVVMLL